MTLYRQHLSHISLLKLGVAVSVTTFTDVIAFLVSSSLINDDHSWKNYNRQLFQFLPRFMDKGDFVESIPFTKSHHQRWTASQ